MSFFFFFFLIDFLFYFTSATCLSSSLLPSGFCVCLSYTQRRQFLSKVLVYYCFLVYRRIAESISLDLFCFVVVHICVQLLGAGIAAIFGMCGLLAS